MLASTIRTTRQSLGWTQETVAAMAQVAQPIVAKAEAGRRVGSDAARAICCALGIEWSPYRTKARCASGCGVLIPRSRVSGKCRRCGG